MHRSIILESTTPAAMRADFSNLEEAIIARIKEVDKELAHDTFQF
jgi:hypothetical protein